MGVYSDAAALAQAEQVIVRAKQTLLLPVRIRMYHLRTCPLSAEAALQLNALIRLSKYVLLPCNFSLNCSPQCMLLKNVALFNG